MIDRTQFAEGLHASLRKFSDTEQSVFFCHLISAMPPPVWAWYVGELCDRLDRRATLAGAFGGVSVGDARDAGSIDPRDLSLAAALLTSFHLIDRATLSDLETALGGVIAEGRG